jgi:hypothetical protein
MDFLGRRCIRWLSTESAADAAPASRNTRAPHGGTPCIRKPPKGQADQAARAGVDSGGAAAQSAQKRGANWQDIVNQLNYGRDQAVASAKQGFDRANSAADTQFQRAGATNTLFHSQLNREEVYGAQQAGLLPPVKTMPKFPPNRRFVGIKGARI